MLYLQLFADGLVTGCAIGLVAVSFSLIYSTTKVFHVAHAGIYTAGGYIAWFVASYGAPFTAACVVGVIGSALLGAVIQSQVYQRLEDRSAPPLVLLIASLGVLAVLQNGVAILFTTNMLQFSYPWRNQTVILGGAVGMTYAQITIVIVSVVVFAVLSWMSKYTLFGQRIRAVASNPFLAEITRLRPKTLFVLVMMIGSAIVGLAGSLIALDQAMQPYTGVLILLTATIAVIAGGIGSLTGAFVISLALSVLQNLSLAVMPGRWSIAATFALFILFILMRPQGLVRAAR
jgi:branched-chain amino acid transport system permease protein